MLKFITKVIATPRSNKCLSEFIVKFLAAPQGNISYAGLHGEVSYIPTG